LTVGNEVEQRSLTLRIPSYDLPDGQEEEDMQDLQPTAQSSAEDEEASLLTQGGIFCLFFLFFFNCFTNV